MKIMKKLIAVILLACMLLSAASASADGLLDGIGDLVGAAFGSNEFDVADFDTKLAAIEDFFDEYCTFMGKMAKHPEDPTLIAEYGTMLSRYADAMEAIDSIDENSLTAAEEKKFNAMLLRIDKKLLKLGMSLS